jgi:hypothetical protein
MSSAAPRGPTFMQTILGDLISIDRESELAGPETGR